MAKLTHLRAQLEVWEQLEAEADLLSEGTGAREEWAEDDYERYKQAASQASARLRRTVESLRKRIAKTEVDRG